MKYLFTILLLIVTNVQATTYYVKPSGDNGSAGTSWATAWAHPNKTNGSISRGDSVIFAAASWDTVHLRPPTSGTGWTVYTCTSSVRAATVLSSAQTLTAGTGNWTQRSGDVYRYNSTIPLRWNAWLSDGDGVAIQNGRALMMVTTTSLSEGQAYYDPTNDSLFVYARGGGNPGSHVMEYSQTCVFRFDDGDMDSVVINGMTLNGGGGQAVIVLASANGESNGSPDMPVMQNCIIQNSGSTEAANNQSLIYCGNNNTVNDASLGLGLRVINDTLRYANNPSGVAEHAGAGLDLYAMEHVVCSASVFLDMQGTALNFKNGGHSLDIDNCVIMDCFFDSVQTGIRIGPNIDSLIVCGNIITNCEYRGIDVHSSAGTPDAYDRVKIFNNTLWNASDDAYGEDIANEAIIISPTAAGAGSGNEVRYNIIFDTATVAPSIGFYWQDTDVPLQDPSVITYWDVDSNMYYHGASSFSCRLISGSGCTGTDWAAWTDCGFDSNGLPTTNPNFAASQTPSRVGLTPNSAPAMSRTYAGRTWTQWGAVQAEDETDSCILITALPDTLDVADTCYCLTDRKMSSAGNGLLVTARNVRLINRLETRDTLVYGTDGGDSYKGVHIAADNFKIDGLYVWHNPSAPIDSAKNNICIYSADADTVKVYRTHVRPNGMNGRGFQNNSGGFNIDLWRVTHDSSDVHLYESRCSHDANIFYLIPEPDHDDGDYFFKAHMCSVYNAPHNILATAGGPTYLPKFYIDTNYFAVDARNDLYTLEQGEADACHSSGDAAGIDVMGAGPGARISYNVIRSGSANEGGVGILLQNAMGASGDSVLVVGNDVDVSNGPSNRFSAGRTFGLYFRYVPGTGNTGSQYVAVRDNSWKTTVDTDTNTTHIGREAETWSLILSGCGTGDNESDSFKHIDFRRNRVTSTRSGTMTGWWEGSAIAWGSCDSSLAAYANNGNITFSGNRYIGSRTVVEIGNMQGIPGSNWLSVGDTIDAITDTDSTITFDRTGTYDAHSTNNRIRDAVWANNADDASVAFDLGGSDDNDTLGLSVRFERTLGLLVLDSNGDPVDAADVWVWNNYSDTVLIGQSDASGEFSGVTLYKFLSEDKFPADSYVLSDSTGFNPFTIKAKKGTDSAEVSLTISATVASDTVQFAAAVVSQAVYMSGIIIQGVRIK